MQSNRKEENKIISLVEINKAIDNYPLIELYRHFKEYDFDEAGLAIFLSNSKSKASLVAQINHFLNDCFNNKWASNYHSLGQHDEKKIKDIWENYYNGLMVKYKEKLAKICVKKLKKKKDIPRDIRDVPFEELHAGIVESVEFQQLCNRYKYKYGIQRTALRMYLRNFTYSIDGESRKYALTFYALRQIDCAKASEILGRDRYHQPLSDESVQILINGVLLQFQFSPAIRAIAEMGDMQLSENVIAYLLATPEFECPEYRALTLTQGQKRKRSLSPPTFFTSASPTLTDVDVEEAEQPQAPKRNRSGA